ncbi:TrlF family AAA-like ATPase [Candidatus Spongiisocius sp.]|uniref:TrlF family AAA-like ATPase n=1 Tax=Candidatus Spongiisocius sp. TaxID=3101273 RepID=UPI003B5B47B2
MSASWDWPGSRWWRVDLHCHSPASHDSGADDATSSPDWIGWVEAARDAGLHAVAVTDHNTATGIEPLQRVAAQVENAPVLFPGVELTTGDGCHLLLLMDPAREGRHIEDLLSRLEVPIDGRGDPESGSSLSVQQVLNRCDNGVIVLAAHANGPRGLLTRHTGLPRIKALQDRRLAAVEVDPAREIDRKWIDGSLPEIGRQVSEVHSSDSHRAADLGRRFTWVKMTRPDLDGLRLALLDGTGSLLTTTGDDARDPNEQQAAMAIESVTVDAARHMGRPSPVQIDLSPWLNVLIGGRGTGKSTLVDFCRKTLRRDSELDSVERTEDRGLRSVFDRRMRVPSRRDLEGLLTRDTKIEIVYRKDGARFTLSWNNDGSAQPISVIEGDARRPEEGDIRELFPARIYSQKQLFAIAQNPKALLSVIDDSPDVNGADLGRRMSQLRDRYLALRAGARAEARKARERPNRTAALADVRRKLKVLEEGGQAQVLNEYRRRRRSHGTWDAILESSESKLDAVSDSVEEVLVPDLDIMEDRDHDDQELRHLHVSLVQTVEGARSDLTTVVRKARQDIDTIRSGPDATQWRQRLDASYREFERVKAELEAEGISDPNDYSQLLLHESRLRDEINGLVEAEARAEALDKEAATVLASYRKLRQELGDRRYRFAQDTSTETIRVEVRRYGDTESLIEHLGDQLGTDVFEKDRGALVRMIRPEGSRTWDWRRLDGVVKQMRVVLAGDPPSWNIRHKLLVNRLQNTEPERLDRIALYVPEDMVTVSFRDNARASWRPLEQGSPGQQTAALLAFVLGYGTEPIILDQPEDDLDNTLIYDLLVTSLRQTKQSRQIIIVTHNPNIVVHGDAELVISLESGGGQSHVTSIGGLQESTVRAEVCRVMEGGQEAFESRYRRIMPPSM